MRKAELGAAPVWGVCVSAFGRRGLGPACVCPYSSHFPVPQSTYCLSLPPSTAVSVIIPPSFTLCTLPNLYCYLKCVVSNVCTFFTFPAVCALSNSGWVVLGWQVQIEGLSITCALALSHTHTHTQMGPSLAFNKTLGKMYPFCAYPVGDKYVHHQVCAWYWEKLASRNTTAPPAQVFHLPAILCKEKLIFCLEVWQ